MQENKIIAIKSTIKQNIYTDKYKILSEILGVPRSTAVSRYQRNNKEAVLIMSDIVKNQQKFITKLKAKYKNKKGNC